MTSPWHQHWTPIRTITWSGLQRWSLHNRSRSNQSVALPRKWKTRSDEMLRQASKLFTSASASEFIPSTSESWPWGQWEQDSIPGELSHRSNPNVHVCDFHLGLRSTSPARWILCWPADGSGEVGEIWQRTNLNYSRDKVSMGFSLFKTLFRFSDHDEELWYSFLVHKCDVPTEVLEFWRGKTL